MKTLASLIIGLSLVTSALGAEKKQTTAEHLQNVSVTIRSEGQFSAGEGSGVIFTRKDKDGKLTEKVPGKYESIKIISITNDRYKIKDA